ncbi:translocation/assembly module TamB domain-containing protein [Blochmannia endosymbiont of Camponotus nipponensis]|uniref:autotransporter assembly complex protein TamB n=1 Tax=Blochmannia endosymbiont of Camponotus nipponensis TaxID=2681986 RepID=UPI001F0010AB|nr:translocation/assembly module TamB domain-containing protein [Blochmannia endosymbiont of Camponotus nipponensis]
MMCGVFIFLLGTNVGTYLTLTGITYCIPGLKFDSVSGGWGDFNINNMVYNTSMGTIAVDKCNIFLNLKCIWNKQIYIDHLFLENVHIKINKTDMIHKEHKRYEKIKKDNIFSVPFPIILKNVTLHNTRIKVNNVIFELIKLDAGLIFQNNLLTVLPVNIKGAVVNITDINMSNVKTNAINIYRYSSNWNIKFLLRSLSNQLLTTLSYCNIPLNIIVEDIKGENCYIFDKYNHRYVVNYFFLQTYLCNQVANIKLNIKLPYGYFNITGNVIFQEYYPINIIANYILCDAINTSSSSDNIENRDVSQIKLVITGELYNELCLKCDFLGAIATVHVLLKTRIMQFGVPISISVVGRKIPLYFLGKNDALVEEFDFYLDGGVRNYCIQVTSKLSGATFSSARIVMDVQGDVNGCIISKLRATVLDGYIEMKGVVNWNDMISWNSVFVLNKINIFQKWLKYPIKLSGNITNQGRLCSNIWDVVVSNVNLHGSIENNRISCIGALYINSIGKWKIPALSIKWGSNMLEIKGDLKEEASVCNIMLVAPDLSTIVPELSGSVYGKFKLYGPFRCARLLLSMDVCSLCWRDKDLNIDKITVNSDVCCDVGQPSKFFFQADKIRYGMFSLRKLIVQGKGNIKQHFVRLITDGDMLSGEIKLCGHVDFVHKHWNSRIYKTSIITAIGTWKLMQDVVLTYQYLTRKMIVDSHFWEGIDCVIPVSNVLKINILNKVNDLLKNFNLVSLKILLPELISVNAVRIYCTNCYWTWGALLPRGTISLSGKRFYIKSSIKEAKTTVIKINNIKVKAVLTQKDVYCKWGMNIGDDDESSGTLRIDTTLSNTSKIEGNVQIKNILLVPFCNLLVCLKKPVSGLLNLNIHFYGYIHQLRIHGSARLQNFSINQPKTPFFFKNGVLFINFFGDHAVLNGIIDTDYGCRLYLDGDIINFNSISNIRVFFKIRGNQVNFCASPDIMVKMSPDIICTITSKKIHIQGNIEIPWAYIKAKEYSKNIISISSEEILLDDNFIPISDDSKNLFISVSSDINVRLGNDVHFNGFGLRMKLRGNLGIRYNNNHIALTGNVDIPSGHFQAYGQNLIIKKGQLLFSGAINQPYLDVEAVCDSSNIKNGSVIGIRVTGIFSQLKIETFSNSLSFSPQEVISYLFDRNNNVVTSNTDANLATSLLIGASIKSSEKLINKIGKVFGVQELTLNTQDFGIASWVALSGYIAPGLQIKYGVSIFDLLTIITARYCLCSQLYLEVTSGSNQAIDVLYKFAF